MSPAGLFNTIASPALAVGVNDRAASGLQAATTRCDKMQWRQQGWGAEIWLVQAPRLTFHEATAAGRSHGVTFRSFAGQANEHTSVWRRAEGCLQLCRAQILTFTHQFLVWTGSSKSR